MIDEQVDAIGRELLLDERALGAELAHQVLEAAADGRKRNLVLAADRRQDVRLHQVGERKSQVPGIRGPDDRAETALPGEPGAQRGLRHAEIVRRLADGVGRHLACIEIFEIGHGRIMPEARRGMPLWRLKLSRQPSRAGER